MDPVLTPPGPAAGPRDVLLYDGDCSFCGSGAAWVRARDRMGRFELLPYQSDEVPRRFPALDPEAVEAEMHVVTADGRVLRGVDAAAHVFRGLPGWGWLGATLGSRVLGPVAWPAYRWIASRRRLLPLGFAERTLNGP